MYSMKQIARLRKGRIAVPLLLGMLHPALPAWCQDSVTEQTAIGGNSASIVVTVRNSSGDPLPVVAMVKLFRNGTIPNGQATTSQGGRAIFLPQNLGGFLVVVEAAGYKQGRANVDVPIPVRAEVDVYLEPEAASTDNTTAPGNPLLAPKAKETLEKALTALRANRLEEAERLLGEVMKLAPGHPDVLYLQGILYLRREKWVQAQTVLEKATQINPSHARALAALGTALSDQGKYDAAIAPLEKSLELSAGGWETHWTLAKAYYYHKQYDAALKTSQQALRESDGKAPEIELLVAQAQTSVGRYEDSAQTLRAFLRNHPNHQQATVARRWLDRLQQAEKIRNN